MIRKIFTLVLLAQISLAIICMEPSKRKRETEIAAPSAVAVSKKRLKLSPEENRFPVDLTIFEVFPKPLVKIIIDYLEGIWLQHYSLEVPQNKISHLALANDGKSLAVVTEETEKINVWNLLDNKIISTLALLPPSIDDAKIDSSDDSDTESQGNKTDKDENSDCETDTELENASNTITKPVAPQVTVAISPNGNYIAALRKPDLHIWQSNGILSDHRVKADGTLRFTPDNKYLIIDRADAQIIDVEKNTVLGKNPRRAPVYCEAGFIAYQNDKESCICDLNKKKKLTMFPPHLPDEIHSFTPDGKYFACANNSTYVISIEREWGEPGYWINKELYNGPAYCKIEHVTLSRDGKQLAWILQPRPGNMRDCKYPRIFLATEKKVDYKRPDGITEIFFEERINHVKPTCLLEEVDMQIERIFFSFDGRYLFVLAKEPTKLLIYDTQLRTLVQTIRAVTDHRVILDVNSDGSSIAINQSNNPNKIYCLVNQALLLRNKLGLK